MTTAFVFPGQGSQFVGMGRALFDAFHEARAVFEEVDEALSEKLSALIFEGDEEALRLTPNTQPALMAVSLAAVRSLEAACGKKISDMGSFVAGHSLGEYAALCAAGSLSLAATARLLRKRGLAMQGAVPVGVGGMAALIGADLPLAQDIAAAASQGAELCVAANDNAPGQVVISGHIAAIERAVAIAGERGLRRCIKLPVSAPFHSPLMAPAAEAMRAALEATDVRAPSVPLVANVTAQAVSDPADIRRLLVEQVTGAVRWRESVLYMKAQGVTRLVECGAGSVLAGLCKRIDKDMPAVSVGTPAEVDEFVNSLKHHD